MCADPDSTAPTLDGGRLTAVRVLENTDGARATPAFFAFDASAGAKAVTLLGAAVSWSSASHRRLAITGHLTPPLLGRTGGGRWVAGTAAVAGEPGGGGVGRTSVPGPALR